MTFVDVKGYYQSLGAEPDVTPGALKRAYRARVKEAHPDTGGSEDGAAFREITDAYEILGDPEQRSDYDALCRSIGEARQRKTVPPEKPSGERPSPSSKDKKKTQGPRKGKSTKTKQREAAPEPKPEVRRELPEPVRCVRCGTVSAQPRYVIFRQIIGLLVRSSERIFEGVYCRTCANHVALRASLFTWLFGWWSLPRGPIDTVKVLLRNMAGGEMPVDRNADILTRQSQAFAARGKPALASVLAMQAHTFRPDLVLATLMGLGDGRRLKDRWKIGGLSFVLQALPIGLVTAWLLVWIVRTISSLI